MDKEEKCLRPKTVPFDDWGQLYCHECNSPSVSFISDCNNFMICEDCKEELVKTPRK